MPGDCIDDRKILTNLSQRAIDRILAVGEKAIREYWARYKNRDVRTYSDYLYRKGAQASSVRNLIYNNRNASLHDIYVPTMVSPSQLSGDDLIKTLCARVDESALAHTDGHGVAYPERTPERPTRTFAIVGKAGAGKSLFMRHAFFQIQKVDDTRIPLLVEVRSFNRAPLADLEARLRDDFESMGTPVTREQIENGLRSGLFVILLDGVDELKASIRNHYYSQISTFIVKYPNCPMLVSGRPAQQFLALAFDVRFIAPLTAAACRELIAKLEYEEAVKTAFMALLRGTLYRTHFEFVSTPLLCVIMFLTFSDSGRIASNRHEFYEDAFAALWSKHDNRKDGFERDRYTGLQKSEFLRLLSAFAAASYSSSEYEMRSAQFSRHFATAARLSGVKCKGDDFLQDLTVSTSLIVEDGPYMRFCHRSFQEYFAAVFVAEIDDSLVAQFAGDLCDRIETDNVLAMALSINPEKIERQWILPLARTVSEVINATGTDVVRYAEVVLGGLDSSEISIRKIATAMVWIRFLYELVPDTGTLRSAYDAARGMRTNVRDLTKRTSPKQGLFERDRANFLRLVSSLERKYQNRSSALQKLLKRPAETSRQRDGGG